MTISNHSTSLEIENTVVGKLLCTPQKDGVSTIRVLQLNWSRIRELEIHDVRLENGFIFGGQFETLTLAPASAKRIEMTTAPSNISLRRRQVIINNLEIRPWMGMKETNFIFAHARIRKFTATDISFFNEAYFENLYIREIFNLKNSSLISCRFNNVAFNRACQLNLTRTYLQGSDFVNLAWPFNHRIIEAEKMNYEEAQSIREAYRQLKKVSLDQNNRIDALEFQKNEMRMHYRIVKEDRHKSLRNFGDFLIVGTHNWFSDFGQNIWKPLVLLFAAHLFFFNIFLYTKLNAHFSFHGDWTITKRAVEAYFYTLLPTHGFTINDLATGDEISTVGMVDFLMRISASYFIFYFIYTSRKYHQSN